MWATETQFSMRNQINIISSDITIIKKGRTQKKIPLKNSQNDTFKIATHTYTHTPTTSATNHLLY